MLESKGTFRRKSLCSGKEPKKKLPEEEVQFLKNTEGSGPACKIVCGEREITQSELKQNGLKEQASFLQWGRDCKKEAGQRQSENCSGGRPKPWGKYRPTRKFTEATRKARLGL